MSLLKHVQDRSRRRLRGGGGGRGSMAFSTATGKAGRGTGEEDDCVGVVSDIKRFKQTAQHPGRQRHVKDAAQRD